jgi:UDP-N-acetylglucosamine--N-acetylmuramyl-(pentapeptide) pyrophosphoryl-undecaprenol N-acetylglucosamine transferase
MGYLLGIPVIIHEQTSVVGRANKFSSYFARKIAISRETSLKYFPSDKCVLTGNPIPKDIKVKTGLVSFPTVPILLITGGQSGSVPINNAVEKILTTLLKKYKVIHLTGLKEEKKFIKIKSGLRDQLRKRYLVYGIIDPKEYNRYFNESSILISRSGANTVTKIVATRKPSVLIPLPISYLQEQEINAIFASRISGARVLNQYNLNHSDILKELDYLKNNWKEIYKGLEKQKNPDLSASENIVALMEKNLK